MIKYWWNVAKVSRRPHWHYADRHPPVGLVLFIAVVWGVAAVLAIGRKAGKR